MSIQAHRVSHDVGHVRRAAIIILLIAIPMLPIAGGVAWIVHKLRRHDQNVHQYQEAHSEAKIIGKTPEQIIAMYGKPYSLERDPDRKPVFMMYKQEDTGQYCAISIKDGVAVKVAFSFQ